MRKQLMYLGIPMRTEGAHTDTVAKKTSWRLTELSESELALRLSNKYDTVVAERIMNHAYYEGGYSYKGLFAVIYDSKNGYMIIADDNKYWDLVRPSTKGFCYADMSKLRKVELSDGKFTDAELSAIQYAAQHRESASSNAIYRLATKILSFEEE